VLLYKWLNKQTKALLVVSFAKLTFVFRELNDWNKFQWIVACFQERCWRCLHIVSTTSWNFCQDFEPPRTECSPITGGREDLYKMCCCSNKVMQLAVVSILFHWLYWYFKVRKYKSYDAHSVLFYCKRSKY
jgi:hypothetical protein